MPFPSSPDYSSTQERYWGTSQVPFPEDIFYFFFKYWKSKDRNKSNTWSICLELPKIGYWTVKRQIFTDVFCLSFSHVKCVVQVETDFLALGLVI